MMVRVTPLRSEIHKAKWGQERMGQGWLLASFRGCREIAENADADMRNREKLAFEIGCGEQWVMVGESGEMVQFGG